MVKSKLNRNSSQRKENIIKAIQNPLGFFVLALLIVETFLANILIFGKLDDKTKSTCLYIGCGLFILVVLIVSILVWFRPNNLTYDKEAHIYIYELSLGDSNSEEYSNNSIIDHTSAPKILPKQKEEGE